MPLFEFECDVCHRKFTCLLGMTSDTQAPACPRCGSPSVRKLVSRFLKGRSEEQRVEELADWVESSSEPDSPGKLRRAVREMGKALDEDVSDEMEEMFESEMPE